VTRRAGPTAELALTHLFLVATSLAMLYPVFVMAVSAFRTNAQIFSKPFALPDGLFTGNFERVWAETNLPRYLLNSVLVTGGSVALVCVFGTLAAYALARYRFRGNEFLYLFFLAGLMIPLKLAVIPLFIQLTRLGLIDSLLGLILVYTAMGMPSAVFILTGFLRALPSELEQSARIDGASEGLILWRIMLPLARPSVVIAAIHNAVPIWNDFFFPLVFITSDAFKTMPQGLTVFMGEHTNEWGILFAGLTLTALPITLVYIMLSRQFIAGLTHGALK
jgi:raffinose/stachyose/melibiose transport system permease protein